MISLPIAINDQSVYYLGQIFGSVGGALQANFTTIMGPLFSTINTTALLLGSLLVTHTTVTGIMKTAHEGEFLGKNWHSIWVPVRTVLGISSLFPTASGYSALQIVLMWIILQGVGAADTLWNTALNYVTQFGSIYAQVGTTSSGTASGTPGSGPLTVQQDMKGLFQALTCQETAKENDPSYSYTVSGGDTQHFYYCADNPSDPFCTRTPDDMTNIINGSQTTVLPTTVMQVGKVNVTGAIQYQMGPNGSCGTLTYPDPAAGTYIPATTTGTPQPVPSQPVPVCPPDSSLGGQIQCATLQAQQTAFQTIVSALDKYAASIADIDKSYLQFYFANSPTAAPPPWLVSYCTDQHIAPASCCIYTGNITSSCLTADQAANAFYGYAYQAGGAGGITDYYDANDQASAKIYWTYGLLPVLSTTNNDIITAQANTFNGALSGAVAQVYSNLGTLGFTQGSWQQQASNMGWMMAGGYYYQLAEQNVANIKAAQPSYVLNVPVTSGPTQGPMNQYRNNFQTAGFIVAAISAQTQVNGGSSNPQTAAISGAISGTGSSMMSSFMSSLANTQNGTNPLISIVAFGEYLIGLGWQLYTIGMIAISILLALSAINVMALGTGLTENPLIALGAFLANSMWSAMLFIVGWCFSYGGMLSAYLPLVPYIIYTFSVIGWLTVVIEAMAAAPFIALGILSPGGQHEIMGRADPSILIILNTFLRPSLMVFGMVSGMLLSMIVVQIINSTFLGAMSSVNSSPGIVEGIIFMCVYGFLIVTALNKCFALIYLIPERVLRWIGGQAESFGEAQSLGEVKSGADAGGQAASGAAKGSGEAASGAVGAFDRAAVEKGRSKQATPPGEITVEGKKKTP